MKRKDQLKKLTAMSRADLVSHVDGLAHELMNLRFRKRSSQLTNSARVGNCRREIARAKTLLKATARA